MFLVSYWPKTLNFLIQGDDPTQPLSSPKSRRLALSKTDIPASRMLDRGVTIHSYFFDMYNSLASKREGEEPHRPECQEGVSGATLEPVGVPRSEDVEVTRLLGCAVGFDCQWLWFPVC